MKRTAALAILLCLNLAGCGSSPSEPVVFAPALGIDLSTMTRSPSGLYVQDVTVGNGATAVVGKTLVVHYTGWLSNGTQFNSSRDGAPIDFVLGAGGVIDGWEEGAQGMKVRGQRKLVIPPHLGYGSRRNGPIPGNSTLVFEVELLEVR